MTNLKGFTDQPMATLPNGVRYTPTPYRCDLLPAQSILRIAEILKAGAEKYGEHNWRHLPVEEHFNHGMAHFLAYLSGDTQEDHMANGIVRMLFAFELSRVVDSPVTPEVIQADRHPIQEFIDTQCELNPKAFIDYRRLWDRYTGFCFAKNTLPLPPKLFEKKLESLGLTIERGALGHGVRGIRVRT